MLQSQVVNSPGPAPSIAISPTLLWARLPSASPQGGNDTQRGREGRQAGTEVEENLRITKTEQQSGWVCREGGGLKKRETMETLTAQRDVIRTATARFTRQVAITTTALHI